MKRLAVFLLCLILPVTMTGCGRLELLGRLSRMTGTDLRGGRIEQYADTHGGFLGDGLLTACVRYEAETPEVAAVWKPCPLADGIVDALEAAASYSCSETDVPDYPKEVKGFDLSRGYYWYYNRFAGTQEPPGDGELPLNFTLIVYDLPTSRLYVWELDT